MYTLNIEDSSKLYFTSDSHFNHMNICNYCNRPYSSRQEMNEDLIKRWNEVVPEDGIVVHCGDFILNHKIDIKPYLKIMSKLNGKIYLIRGNHDTINLSDSATENLMSVQDLINIKIGDNLITAFHYPLMSFPTKYHIYGHVHTRKEGYIGSCDIITREHFNDYEFKKKMSPYSYDVGVDQNDYKPISYNKFLSIISKQVNEFLNQK